MGRSALARALLADAMPWYSLAVLQAPQPPKLKCSGLSSSLSSSQLVWHLRLDS